MVKKILLSLFCISLFPFGLFAKKNNLDKSFSMELKPLMMNYNFDVNLLYDFSKRELDEEDNLKEDDAEAEYKYLNENSVYFDDEHIRPSFGKRKLNKQGLYAGIRLGFAYRMISAEPTLIFDSGLVSKYMFSDKNGLIVTLIYQTTDVWYSLYGDIKYIHTFSDSFSLLFGFVSPVKFVRSYEGKSLEIEDLISHILDIYDIVTLGIDFKI